MGGRYVAWNRRQLLSSAAVTACTFALPAFARGAVAPQPRPNILFIIADDLGYADVSCYGRQEYQTPAIDSLARDGTRFTQAYANSPVCSASRTAIMTGRYQYRLPIGLEEPLSGYSPKVGLPPEHPTLPSIFRDGGYQTALIGKWHLGGLPDYSPEKSGYDHFFGFREGGVDYFTHKTGLPDTDTSDLWHGDTKVEEVGYLTDLLGNHAIEQLERFAQEDRPFMMSLHFSAPHWPWEGREDEERSRNLTSILDYDGGDMATFGKMVTRMDMQIGRVLEKLRQLGKAQDTIVIFTSDNGGERFGNTWPFTGKKGELLEGGLRIPAIVRWPARVEAGKTSEQVTAGMDWMPTLLDACGLEHDPSYSPDGRSILPQLVQAAPLVKREIFWRYKANGQHAARKGDWKWLKIREHEFLFNVVDDPQERANLKDRFPEMFNQIKADYEKWVSTMLPIGPQNYTYSLTADHLADHYGNEPEDTPLPPGKD